MDCFSVALYSFTAHTLSVIANLTVIANQAILAATQTAILAATQTAVRTATQTAALSFQKPKLSSISVANTPFSTTVRVA